MELGALDIDVHWNLIQDIVNKDVQLLFDEHKPNNQASNRRKLKTYRKAYLKFVYTPPCVTQKDSFVGLNMDQFQACISGKVTKMQLVVPKKMKGRVAMEEVLVEQKKVQQMEQTTFLSSEIQEQLQ